MPPPKYAAKPSPLNQNFCRWLIYSWGQKFLFDEECLTFFEWCCSCRLGSTLQTGGKLGKVP